MDFLSISGVSIRYERFSELYLKLFAGAVACLVLYTILKRMSTAVSVSGDKFVSIQVKVRENLKNIIKNSSTRKTQNKSVAV